MYEGEIGNGKSYVFVQGKRGGKGIHYMSGLRVEDYENKPKKINEVEMCGSESLCLCPPQDKLLTIIWTTLQFVKDFK